MASRNIILLAIHKFKEMLKFLKMIINIRIGLLTLFGIATYFTVFYFQVSLWYIFGAGVLFGVIFGKVFCRWMCPMGMFMEFLMGLSPDGKMRQMYQYHKLGCPIAWVSGLLNKYSIFKIKVNTTSCVSCGLCDKKCYIVNLNPSKYSLYKPNLEKPGISYTCSKCLECVATCPNGSLTYKI